MTGIGRDEGRRLFGGDAAGYASARPEYPERIYQRLREVCGLRPGTRTLEIGAGSGLATRRLLALGADPLVAVEPDRRLAAHLEVIAQASPALRVVVDTFEQAALEHERFDLAACATAFHWLDPGPALGRTATLLRPGGWIALWWNVFGDPERPDPFHEATKELLAPLGTGPSGGSHGVPSFALDSRSRLADLAAAGFEEADGEVVRWTARLDPATIRALYATFSNITRLPERDGQRVLAALARVAEVEFGGRVERPFVSAIYTARKTGRKGS